MNKVTLIGNTGQDPEIITFENGNRIAKLSLATTEHWKDKQGEKQSATEWHNLIFNGGIVSVVEQYVRKGAKIAIEGRIKSREWTTESGETKKAFEIYVKDMELLTSKQDQ